MVFGQILVALCFMEMAGQYPIAGSVYQWSKQISTGFTSWMTGWIYIVGAIVTIAAVAVDWQVVLPQVTTGLQFFGTAADAGTTLTKHGAQNALLLGGILVCITTIINMLGVKLMSRINNVGVIVRAGRREHPGHPAAVQRAPRRRRSSSTPTASAPGIRGATSGRCSSAVC